MTYRRTGNLFVPTRNIWVPRILAPPMCDISPALIGGIAAARRRSSAIVYDFEENFEAPGYENTGWTTVNSADPSADATDMGFAALEGTYSLFAASGGIRGAHRSHTDWTGEKWFYWKCRFVGGLTDDYLFYGDEAETSVRIGFLSGPYEPYLYINGTYSTHTNTVDVDALVHFWLRYEPGAGGTANGDLYWSTDGTKGSPKCSIASATTTAEANRPYWISRAGYATAWDRIIINQTEIGDNP